MTQKPSEILAQLLNKTPPDSLCKILEKNLHPALDNLPEQARSGITEVLQQALADAERVHHLRNAIGFEKHRKSLEARVKDLEKSVKRSWKHGYEEQAELIEGIANEVLKWLPLLWKIAIEEGLEIQAVQKCLAFCTKIIQRVESCNSR